MVTKSDGISQLRIIEQRYGTTSETRIRCCVENRKEFYYGMNSGFEQDLFDIHGPISWTLRNKHLLSAWDPSTSDGLGQHIDPIDVLKATPRWHCFALADLGEKGFLVEFSHTTLLLYRVIQRVNQSCRALQRNYSRIPSHQCRWVLSRYSRPKYDGRNWHVQKHHSINVLAFFGPVKFSYPGYSAVHFCSKVYWCCNWVYGAADPLLTRKGTGKLI